MDAELTSGRELPGSLKIAAKGLLRHIHNAPALRKNSIVKHLFEGTALPGACKEAAIVASVHDAVLKAAAAYRDLEVAAGRSDRGLRQFAIVAQTLEGKKISAIAAALNISLKYCYRERAAIGGHIAEELYRQHRPSISGVIAHADDFRFETDSVRRFALLGDMASALDRCERLVWAAPSVERKIEAFRTTASVALHFGDAETAKSAYIAARNLAAALPNDATTIDWHIAKACVELTGAKLAYNDRRGQDALRMARRAADYLHTIAEKANPYASELYAESLYQLGAASCNMGDLEKGYDEFARAERHVAAHRSISATVATRVMVGIGQLRTHLIGSTRSWRPAGLRLNALTEAFERAYASGSIPEAVDAAVALTEHHVCAGDGDEALRAGRLAILTARQQSSTRLQTQTAIIIATNLLSTPHWNLGLQVLPSDEAVRDCDAYYRALVSQFPVEIALRRRNFQEALAFARRRLSPDASPFVRIANHMIAATAAKELDYCSEARSFAAAAVEDAERVGSTPTLCQAYGVAAFVSGDVRSKRRARELQRLFTA